MAFPCITLKVWEAVHFPDRNHGEDQEFADTVVTNVNFKSPGKQDLTAHASTSST
jgi:hypothetical protein